MTRKLQDFKNKLNEKLMVTEVKEVDDKRNKILNITFGREQDNFIIIRQENDDKPNRMLFKNTDKQECLKTNSSCDFIIMVDLKNTIKVAFVECKSDLSDYQKASYQLNFSILWFKYLIECYCYCFNADIAEWENIIKQAKKYLIYPSTNAIKIKPFINNKENDIKKCRKLDIEPLQQQLQLNKIHINNPIQTFFHNCHLTQFPKAVI